MTLNGIHAFVTGGGRGLGRASALALARAGAAVTVIARSADEVAETAWLIEESGQQGLGLTADVRDSYQLEQAVAQARARFGPIHVLVAAAGVGLRAPIYETSEAQWDEVVDTLLKGVFLSARAVIPHMVEAGGGNIIIIGAPLERIAVPGFAAYYAAKAGVDGLARVMVKDLRRFGINVNLVHPGGFADTHLVRTTVPEVRTSLLSPDEIGPTIVELAALPPRSQTGQTIDAHARKLASN